MSGLRDEDPSVSFDDSETWMHFDVEETEEVPEHTNEGFLTEDSSHFPLNQFEEEDKEEEEETRAEATDADPLSHNNLNLFESLPPQLHPAVSLGVRRVSSCYLSLHSDATDSVADLLSLLDEAEKPTTEWNDQATTDNLLYHDILMHVFTFLDATSLAAFSETARRPNFEVFYFLQLQLQRALLIGDSSNHVDSSQVSTIAGVGCLERLAALDRLEAERTIQAFCDSNSTLHQMPLSHSLVYLKQLLMRGNVVGLEDAAKAPLASAALLITLMGAAVLGGTAAAELSDVSYGTELLPNMLFKVGFVGSLMGAARSTMSSSSNEPQSSMRARAEKMARQMQQADSLSALVRLLQTAYYEGNTLDTVPEEPTSTTPLTPNPYEHLPELPWKDDNNDQPQDDADSTTRTPPSPPRKLPSGCVGAYSQAIQRASARVTTLVIDQRKARFQALSTAEQQQVSSTLLDSCSSDVFYDHVVDLVVRGVVDVQGFYVGSDGTETCALHAAALFGSTRILELLCRGLDEEDPFKDGGLCDVNLKDSNGWTALHFAAGADSVEAVRILASHGATLSVEAANGYTPLQWAVRLQNHQVAEELRQRIGTEHGWISRQPLSAIASRFFALIPSQ